MRFRTGLSLRSKFILIVLGGAVLPLALLGVWLNQTAERSGERLLRGRLETSLDNLLEDVGLRWLSLRGEILRIADLPEVQRELKARGPSDNGIPGASHAPSGAGAQVLGSPGSALQALLVQLQGSVEALRILGRGGDTVWTMPSDGAAGRGRLSDAVRPLPVQLGVFDLASGQRLGTIDVDLHPRALISGSTAWSGVAGSVLGAFEPETGASLLPVSVDPFMLERERFQWRDETWLSVRRELQDPPLVLALSAPVTPFADPFRESARRNLRILAAVTLVVLVLSTALTRGTTRALIRLADAAEHQGARAPLMTSGPHTSRGLSI